MTRQESIESNLSINDRITPEDLAWFKWKYKNDLVVSRVVNCLAAHMETPDEHDQEMDDLRMKVVTAEHHAERASLLLETWALLHGDECRLDHHGNCQAHYLGGPGKCIVDLTKNFYEG